MHSAIPRKSRYGVLGNNPEPESGEAQLWALNQSCSPLLKLPPELRNRIYDYILGANQRIHVLYKPRVHKKVPRDGQRAREITPRGGFHSVILERKANPWSYNYAQILGRGLTLLAPVCRQLYQETALLPYKWNIWSFETASVMERYILKERRLPLAQRRAIRYLAVLGIPSNSTLTKKMRNHLGGLEKIYFWDAGKRKMKKEIVWKEKMKAENELHGDDGLLGYGRP